jgi:hypothetical protein
MPSAEPESKLDFWWEYVPLITAMTMIDPAKGMIQMKEYWSACGHLATP